MRPQSLVSSEFCATIGGMRYTCNIFLAIVPIERILILSAIETGMGFLGVPKMRNKLKDAQLRLAFAVRAALDNDGRTLRAYHLASAAYDMGWDELAKNLDRMIHSRSGKHWPMSRIAPDLDEYHKSLLGEV